MKKFLAILLTLAMLASCAALAEAPADVYVSISDGTGALALAYAAVSVTDADGDGALTIGDALACAHGAYYPEGAAGYHAESSEWGLSLYRLWGVENGGSYGYCLNDASAMSLLAPVQAGDHVKAYVYTDLAAYSDTYCFFTEPVAAVKVGEALPLTLTANGYDADWNPITMAVAGATLTVNGEKTEILTDENGCAALSFTEPGAYTVSAVSGSQTLVPPVCIVTVTE